MLGAGSTRMTLMKDSDNDAKRSILVSQTGETPYVAQSLGLFLLAKSLQIRFHSCPGPHKFWPRF